MGRSIPYMAYDSADGCPSGQTKGVHAVQDGDGQTTEAYAGIASESEARGKLPQAGNSSGTT
jgi:hypothetical protein